MANADDRDEETFAALAANDGRAGGPFEYAVAARTCPGREKLRRVVHLQPSPHKGVAAWCADDLVEDLRRTVSTRSLPDCRHPSS